MVDFLYIHIPFCIRKCIYCDFLSEPYDATRAERYIQALCRELQTKKDTATKLEAVYIGGGTPSLLSGENFDQLQKSMKTSFEFSPSVEITVEANPGAINRQTIDTMLSLGVNRLSIGIQSFNDNELKTLGRIHSSSDALWTVESVKAAGLINFSVDLLYGIPGQTVESWRQTISRAVALSPCHISTYELTPEKGTGLFPLIKSGGLVLPDEDIILEMYDHAIDHLGLSSFIHYETSNFALPGFESRHNLNYWNRGEYYGVGAGAHSFVGGVRSENTSDIDLYIKNLENGISPEASSIRLTDEDRVREFIFLGLRKSEGLSIVESERNGIDLAGNCGELIDEGLMEINRGYIRITRKGMALSNMLIMKLVEKLESVGPGRLSAS